MPVLATIAWQYASSFWLATLLPLLKKIPWQVWLALGILIAFITYGSYRERTGYHKCQVITQKAADAEKARQKQIAASELLKLANREKEAQEKLSQTTEQMNELSKQVAALKTAKNVCLPRSVTDGIRRLR